MADSLIDSAEEVFLAGNIQSASDLPALAALLDPFFGSVQRYAAAYAVQAAALKKTTSSETDWYGVLQIKNPSSATTEDITHQFVALAKLVDPALHCSAAAPGAYKLISSAWQILSDPAKRCNFDVRSRQKKKKQESHHGLPAPSKKAKPSLQRSRLAVAPPSTDTKLRSCLKAASIIMKEHPRFRNRSARIG